MRPAVVLHTNLPDARELERCILVVGVTSDNQEYNPANRLKYPPQQFIEMPYAADGSSSTSFTVACAAKADWVQRFKVSELGVVEGRLSDSELDALVLKLKAFAKQQSSR